MSSFEADVGDANASSLAHCVTLVLSTCWLKTVCIAVLLCWLCTTRASISSPAEATYVHNADFTESAEWLL